MKNKCNNCGKESKTYLCPNCYLEQRRFEAESKIRMDRFRKDKSTKRFLYGD